MAPIPNHLLTLNTLQSSWTSFFLSDPTANLWVNAINSIFTMSVESNHFDHHQSIQVIISPLDYCNNLLFFLFCLCSLHSVFNYVASREMLLKTYTIMIQLGSETSSGFPSHSKEKPKYFNDSQALCSLAPYVPVLFHSSSCLLTTTTMESRQLQHPRCASPSRFTLSPTSYLSSLLTSQRGHPWLHFSFIPYILIEQLLSVMQYLRILGYNSDYIDKNFWPCGTKGKADNKQCTP